MAPAGVWGEPSSTIDWCEENYAVTPYIAEFWNTVSNLMMIVPPLLSTCFLIKQQFEKKIIVSHISLLSVGLGSWCFHMTLLYSMQLLDELPMIWGTGFIIYSLLEVKAPLGVTNVRLMTGILTYNFIVTIVYIICKEPIFFQAAYAIQVILVVTSSYRAISALETCDKSLVYQGIISYGSGFCLWMLDIHFCFALKYLRSFLGPFAPLLQFHAWWHVLAGLGTYLGLIFVAHARCLVLRKQAHIKRWMGVLPYVIVESPILPS